ncbi:MAG: hypothetical protein ACJASP_000652, partial [Roseivirga sp.]
ANFTTSIGVSASSTLPPIVPLIPEIDLINVTVSLIGFADKFSKNHRACHICVTY